MAGQKNVRETMRCVSQQQAQKLLHNKFVVVLGDSIQRSVYKDLVLLLQKEKYLSLKQLKTKGEMSFEQDCLVEGGCLNNLHNGTQYTEVRQYQSAHHLVRFYFITRVFSTYMRSIIEDFRHGLKPDVVIANSCVWDISRYNSSWLNDYKQNLDKFFDELKSVLPEETLIIWNVTMPLGERIKGGFLVPEIQHKAPQLRYDVIEGNYYSGTLADIHGMDVLDLHYQFRFSLHHRTNDGVHWNAIAHRKITSLLLQHVAQAWGVDMPCPLKAVENTVPQPAHVNATKPAGGHQVQGTKYHYSPPADYFFNMERQLPRRNYNYQEEFSRDTLSHDYLSFENQHPQQVWHEQDTRAHRPALLPPPHRRHKNKHGHDGNGFHFQTLHHYEPYNENHHQQVMRSRRSRYHYAPYTHHRVNQYSHNGQYY